MCPRFPKVQSHILDCCIHIYIHICIWASQVSANNCTHIKEEKKKKLNSTETSNILRTMRRFSQGQSTHLHERYKKKHHIFSQKPPFNRKLDSNEWNVYSFFSTQWTRFNNIVQWRKNGNKFSWIWRSIICRAVNMLSQLNQLNWARLKLTTQ